MMTARVASITTTASNSLTMAGSDNELVSQKPPVYMADDPGEFASLGGVNDSADTTLCDSARGSTGRDVFDHGTVPASPSRSSPTREPSQIEFGSESASIDADNAMGAWEEPNESGIAAADAAGSGERWASCVIS